MATKRPKQRPEAAAAPAPKEEQTEVKSPSLPESASPAPDPLPLPGEKKPRRKRKTTGSTAGLVEGATRPLPSDPDEIDAVLGPYRILAKPAVSGVSKLAVTLKTEPLDDDERESGELSIAAMLYQYGAQLDGRVLFAMWATGVILPRAADYFAKREERELAAQQAKQQQLHAPDTTKQASRVAQLAHGERVNTTEG